MFWKVFQLSFAYKGIFSSKKKKNRNAKPTGTQRLLGEIFVVRPTASAQSYLLMVCALFLDNLP